MLKIIDGADNAAAEAAPGAAPDTHDAAEAAPAPALAAGDGEVIGHIASLSGQVTIARADGSEVSAGPFSEIYQGDTVLTGADGAAGLVFADDTTFSLGAAGEMTVDSMSYDPESGVGEAMLAVARGPFAFVSGQLAKADPEAMTITTPVAEIGIRGSAGNGVAAPEGGQNTFVLVPDPNGTVGEITIQNETGIVVLNVPYAATEMLSSFISPTRPVVLPASVVTRVFGDVAATMTDARAAAGVEDSPPPPAAAGAGEAEAEVVAQAAQDAAAAEQAFEAALQEGGSMADAFQAAADASAEQVAEQEEAEREIEAPGENDGADDALDRFFEDAGEAQRDGRSVGEQDRAENPAPAPSPTPVGGAGGPGVGSAPSPVAPISVAPAPEPAPEPEPEPEPEPDLTPEPNLPGTGTETEAGKKLVTTPPSVISPPAVMDQTFTGDENANTLTGGAGDDTLIGLGGDDTLTGGDGADNFVIGPDDGVDTIDDFDASEGDTLTLGAEVTGANFQARALGDRYNNADGVIIIAEDIDMTDEASIASDLTAGRPAQANTTVYLVVGNATDSAVYLFKNANGRNVEEAELTKVADLPGVGMAGRQALTDANFKLADVGGAGVQTLDGEDTPDFLYGGGGDDILNGMGGDDTLVGGAGDDTMDGGEGSDIYKGVEAGDTINDMGASSDTDTVETSGTQDFSAGTFTGIEKVVMTAAANVTFSNTQADALNEITFGTGAQALTVKMAAAGTLDLSSSQVILTDFTDGADSITIDATGNTEAQIITGTDKDDIIKSGAGNDTVNGGAGDDTIDGGAGIDTMDGGEGSDTYKDVSNVDIINDTGGAGTDTVETEGTQDFTGATITGIEHVNITAAATVTFTSAQIATFDEITFGTGVQNLTVTAASDETLNMSSVVTLTGFTDGTDIITINGAGGSETITGTANADIINAMAGTDTIVAGDGDDKVILSAGADTITLGAGDDKIMITDWANADGHVIEDFKGDGADTIVISGITLTDNAGNTSTAYKNLAGSGTNALNLTGGNKANSIYEFENNAMKMAGTATEGTAVGLAIDVIGVDGSTNGSKLLTVHANAENIFILYDNNNNAAVFYFNNADGNTRVDAGELTLLAFLKNVAQGSLVEADFTFATDPLVFDLDGDGVHLQSAAAGAHFDIDGDGEAEATGWFGAGDAMLVIDENENGRIDGMGEVVSASLTWGGGKAAGAGRSLDALARFDDNDDGVIDESDAIFSVLRLWRDENGDGVTDEGELLSLKDFGIAHIGLGGDGGDGGEDHQAGGTVHRTVQAVKDNGETVTVGEVSFDPAAPGGPNNNANNDDDAPPATMV